MRTLSSAFKLVLGLTVMGLSTAVFTVVCLLLLPWRAQRIRATNVFGHVAGFTCAWLSGARFPLDARKPLEQAYPAIYVSNHTSILDIFIGIWLCPLGTCGIGKREVVWYPFFGQLYLLGGHLRLDRKNIQSAKMGMKQVADLVHKHNLGIWMWPEGTRSRDGRLQPLKKGFAHLALATGLPIVPVVVTGAHRVWEKNKLTMQGGRVDIRTLPAIPTAHWKAETLDAHIAEVFSALNDALPPDQKAAAVPVSTPEMLPMPAPVAVPAVQPAA